MKRLLKILFICIIMMIIISTSIALYTKLKQPITVPTNTIMNRGLPIFFQLDQELAFNPMVPYRNQVDPYSIDDTIALFENESSMVLYVDKKDIGDISYSLISPDTNKIIGHDEIPVEERTDYSDGYKLTVPLDGLTENEEYVIELEITYEGYPIYYYQRLYMTKNRQSDILSAVLKAHQLMIDGDIKYKMYLAGNDKDGLFYEANIDSDEQILMWKGLKDFVRMNEPIPKITSYNPASGEFKVKLEFVIANRRNGNFEYWDFEERYQGVYQEGSSTFSAYQRHANRKDEPYFDAQSQKMVLDEGIQRNIDQNMISKDGAYSAFVYKNELWRLEMASNQLTKVFEFDHLNSDYILDENNDHAIKLLEVDNKGNIRYMIYGYMAAGEMCGYNGIMINKYQNSANENRTGLFIQVPNDLAALNYYIMDQAYYNDEFKKFYFTIDCNLYQIDLNKNAYSLMTTLPPNNTFSKEGFLYAVDTTQKDNTAIWLYDLTSEKYKEKLLTLENTNIRPLTIMDNQLILGLYQFSKTYEFLDGHVFYPYESIWVVNKLGEVIEQYKPKEGNYFNNLRLQDDHKTVLVSNFGLKKDIQSNPKKSKVTYEKLGDEALWVNEGEKSTPINFSYEIKDQIQHLLINNDRSTLEGFVNYATSSDKNIGTKDILKTEKSKVYEVYSNKQLIGVTRSLQETFPIILEKDEVSVVEKEGGLRKVVYQRKSIRKEGNKMILGVPLVAQRPELIRGCEVTALSMFLSYHLKESIDKTTLFTQIRMDTTPYTIDSGLISFGDMNKGFVGNMVDYKEPGLGVYIPALYGLAQQYIDKDLYDLTGCSFDQVLYYIEQGSPVLVITPINYRQIEQYNKEDWLTPSGYMEVCSLEHSVVIVGFDDTYVYFNDPNNGRLQKQARDAFKIGWEQQGSRSMAVIS